MNVIPETRRAY